MGQRDQGLWTPQSAAERAVAAIGCGYNLSSDLRLTYCKPHRLIELDESQTHDLVFPDGVVVSGVPREIKCDKGERTRFRSDVVSFHQMAEEFNQGLSLSGKIPSGMFNTMFDFRGCWQKDVSSTKSLCFDGWFFEFYGVEIPRSRIVLQERIREEVPDSWDAAALAKFIEKYGTHVIVGVKMGGKDVISIKQLQESVLQKNDVQNILKKLADENFAKNSTGDINIRADQLQRKIDDSIFAVQDHNATALKPTRSSLVTHLKKDDVVIIHVRRGGSDIYQSHKDWLSSIYHSPDVISMSFVPITCLLNRVRGSGFISHAVNLYLRCKTTRQQLQPRMAVAVACWSGMDKPPIEELQQFLDFQLPRQWAPAFGELPLGPHRRKRSFPTLQFTLLGPKLHVNTVHVDSSNRPVTGIRLYLEGNKNDRLAIHLQHLSALPSTFQLSNDAVSADDDTVNERAYFEPIKWALLSHVCTAPVQYSGAHIDDWAAVVTKAWLEVKEVGMRKVLFLRLGFSSVASMRIRRSEWDGPSITSRKSGSISALISSRFSTGLLPPAEPKVEVNSAIFPRGPPVPLRVLKMSRFVDTTEMSRGPDDLPGYWVVTGAKLCVEGGKIFLKVKYSLLVAMLDDDDDFGF
ncbi:MACPF domain-containing protein NSL1 isoform X2 [Typha angustifolia]|uniref:MACPF domain-containing protein NSL1 isoform X2 n=1 Tax=Typha angustifolia TaxID=59011 RepID=UPI003C2ADCDD